MADLLVALALVLVIEGALYALFPDAMRRSVAIVLSQPTERIRMIGLGAAILGVALVWLVRG
ncbi:MAG: DUF2065 domain-containing protein [Minwuia sp.]|nr:DUF2065 domain-containing protein [Minwuia sp.]